MPNWCWTNYTVTGAAKDIAKLESALDDVKAIAIKENREASRDGEDIWLGHIYTYLGESKEDIREGKAGPARGGISCIERDDESIRFEATTAWAPLHYPIVKLIDHVAPDTDIVYRAEEPNMSIYVTNDPEFEGKWLFEVWDDTDIPENLTTLCRQASDLIPGPELHRELIIALNKVDDLDKLAVEAMTKWEISLHMYEKEELRRDDL